MVRLRSHEIKRQTHQPAKIHRYKVSVMERPDPVPLNVHIYSQTSGCLVSAAVRSPDVELTLLVTDEGDLWVFHIDLPAKIHPTETIDNVSLPVLRNRVCITSNGELKGCLRDIMGPFIKVSPGLLVYFFVRCARGVQFAYRP